ncbi:MAG: type II secretion system protein [Candidatus Acidiferrales bacterium]
MMLRVRKTATSAAGMTLLELILATGILMVLAGAAVPILRVQIRREKEIELRRALRQMRDAIDRYYDAADRGLIKVEVGTYKYPPDLDTLVKGVQMGSGGNNSGGTVTGETVRFLSKIPVDPMTGRAEWGKRAVQDDPDSSSWNGKNVFEVYSLSQGIALDGTKYADW